MRHHLLGEEQEEEEEEDKSNSSPSLLSNTFNDSSSSSRSSSRRIDSISQHVEEDEEEEEDEDKDEERIHLVSPYSSISSSSSLQNNNNNNNIIEQIYTSIGGGSILTNMIENDEKNHSPSSSLSSPDDHQFHKDDPADTASDIAIDLKKSNQLDSSQQQQKQHTKFFEPPFPPIRDPNHFRYVSLIWGSLVILISGTLYGFSVVSNEVKHKLGYSQTEINQAISLGDVGIYVGVTVGYLYDRTGPFYTCLIATGFYLLGYFGCYGVVQGALPSHPLLLSFFLFIVGQGSHASFTAAVVSNVYNFPLRHHGKISGLLVGFFAISSGIFSGIYKGTFKKHQDVDGYFMFLALLLASVSLVGAFLVRKIGTKQIEQSIQETSPTSSYELLRRSKLIQSSSQSNLGLGTTTTTTTTTATEMDQQPSSLEEDGIKLGPNYLDGKRDISGLELFKTLEFWLFVTIYFFGAGTSLMLLNNIGSIALSLGYKESIQSDLVIVFACSNLVGRLSFGLLSDLLSKRVSRFWFLVLSSLILTITHFVFAFAKQVFVVVTILTGVGYGGLVSMMVSLATIRFGSRRFGLNFGLMALASAAGSLAFGYISGALYDSMADSQHQCYGIKCFRSSFLISVAFNGASIFVGLFLIYITKRNQSRYIAKTIIN
ncbi:hypothetical protein DFA_11846 [Cavenderia fasciculata]|uniref:Major facilitator superfamily (MFS) profile domain-containing protein n=1 Tax=Cavenderia fasciculata TaxID=261658 RepID=F4QED6_CACFS|nr:uncharacterized protein DFA_11846 [Cavenderia fasciculata]EGG14083.1 hypothetical protein DFA_11846 [Cavenderia fasciculata]|eukprot:XP_004350791.1 hypothetical protein DFA_11846 [Cavenderia fasciculata]